MITHKAPTKKPTPGSAPPALPPWVIAGVLGVALLLAVLIGWHTLVAPPNPAGPDRPVHPGMYNLRQELQKGMAAKHDGDKSEGDKSEGKRSAP